MRIRAGLRAVYVLFFLAAGALFYYGRDYYLAPAVRRPRLPLHPLLRQSGIVGHGLGVAGALFMLLLLGYSLRKRVRFMWTWGNASDWLEVHIFLGIAGPVLVLLHTDFRFSGLVGISFWAMALVVASGVVGRYVFQSIPRSISGTELSRIELEAEEIGLTYELRKRIPRGHPIWEGMAALDKSLHGTAAGRVRTYREASRLRARFNRDLKKAKTLRPGERRKLLKLISNRQKLGRRKEFLDRTQKILYYWHLFHVPFVILMFLILAVHVYVSVRMGNRWIF